MKKWSFLFLSLLLLLSLPACADAPEKSEEDVLSKIAQAAQEAPESAEDAPSQTDAKEPKSPQLPQRPAKRPQQPAKADPVDATEAYDPVIQQLAAVAADPSEDWEFGEWGVMGVWQTAYDLRMEGLQPLEGIGYCIRDLSGDGVPELAVASLPECGDAYSPYGDQVFLVSTLVDGRPQPVLEGWYLSTCTYLGGGRFSHWVYNDDGEVGFGTGVLTRDGTTLETEHFYFTDTLDEFTGEMVFYQNETGDWDIAHSERVDLTWDDIWAQEEEPADLGLTPFSEVWTGEVPASTVSVWPLYDEELEYYDLIPVYDGDDACHVLFTADGPVEDFTLLHLWAEEFYDDGSIRFSTAPAGTAVLTPTNPIAASLGFPGTIPTCAISYTDSNGAPHRFALLQSGYDGSIFLQEADPLEVDFILG